MPRINLQISIALVILFTVNSVVAQELTNKITAPAGAPVITGTVSAERLRFTAPNTVVQMQLQIYSDEGKVLFDATSKGNVLDWTLQDGGGEHLVSGSYLCVVTVKSLSGRLSQRIGSALVQEKQVELQRVDPTQFTAAQQQAVGPIEENGALTILKPLEGQATTVLANDGNEGQIIRSQGALSFRLGDFFSGADQEQMRLTEEGNLGLGTDKPQAKLDVAGTIRARGGFQFFNGSKLNMNDKGGLLLTNADGSVVPNAAGNGTQNRVAKWTENGGAGTLGDSLISESNGNMVVGNAGQTGNIQIFGTANQDVFAGMGTDIANGPAFNYGYAGLSFGRSAGFFNVRPDASAVAPNPSLRFMTANVQRMIVTNTGDVGIGNTAPSAKLDVTGIINTSTQYNIGNNKVLSAPASNIFAGITAGDTNTSGDGNAFVGVGAGSHNTSGNGNSFFGGGTGFQNITGNDNTYIGTSAGGLIPGITQILNSTAVGARAYVTRSHSLVLGSINGVNGATSDASVGIGTTSPRFRFHVRTGTDQNLAVRSGAELGVSGIAIQAIDDAIVGYQPLALEGSLISLNAASSGNVGIGTTVPEQRLHVDGASEILSSGSGGGFKFRDRGTASFTGDWVWYSTGDIARLFKATVGDLLFINTNGNLGVGASSPTARLQVTGGDAAITTQSKGLILRATDGGSCYRVTVNNGGILSTTSVPCP